MQLAVDVHIPTEFGGVGGEAVYIGESKTKGRKEVLHTVNSKDFISRRLLE